MPLKHHCTQSVTIILLFFIHTNVHVIYSADSDSKRYKSALRVAEELIGNTQIAMLKVSLAMHSMSPRVQAHFQIAQEVIAHGDCNTKTFLTIGNRVACNMDELKKGIAKVIKHFDGREVQLFFSMAEFEYRYCAVLKIRYSGRNCI